MEENTSSRISEVITIAESLESVDLCSSSSLSSSSSETETVDPAGQYVKLKLGLLAKKCNEATVDSPAASSSSNTPCYLIETFIHRLSNQAASNVSAKTAVPQHEAQVVVQHTSQLERLKLEAVQHRMDYQIKKLEQEVVEIEDRCGPCSRNMEHKLAQKRFIQWKVNLISEHSLTKRIEHHLYEKDSITLLGEIVSSCVRPSATSEEVWRRIRDTLFNTHR